MDKTINIVLAGLVIAGVTVGGALVAKPVTVNVDAGQSVSGVQGQPGTDGADGRSTPSFGALAGPLIPSPFLTWGDVTEERRAQNFTATSSVLCALQGPTSTSTIDSFTFATTDNRYGAISVDVSTSSTAYASSSPGLITALTLSTENYQQYIWLPGVASTTRGLGSDEFGGGAGNSPYIISPNQYVTLRIATATPGTFATYSSGTCKATFKVI